MRVRYFMLTGLTVALAAPSAAQDRVAGSPCPGGAPVGDLGYSGLSCNCTYYYDETDPDSSVWRFRSEPRIEGVKRGGPADGRLRRGDLIVAIDGALITSDEGGRRFARLEPGRPTTLTIRRGGREETIEITPAGSCPSGALTPAPAPVAEPRAPGAVIQPTPAPSAVRTTVPKVPRVPPPPKRGSRAWLGFSLRCSQCGWSQTDDTIVWEFSEPPIVEQVDPAGPAAAAGLQDGDQITHINGHAITSAHGGRLFGAIEPGDRVGLRLIRDQRARTLTLTAADAASKAGTGLRGNLTPAMPVRGQLTPLPDVERFTGTIGDALVQVTGGAVSVTQTDDEIVIRSADVTVRIRRTNR